jgi:secreted PhoX family phosphatase
MVRRSRRSFLCTVGAIGAGAVAPGSPARADSTAQATSFVPPRVPQPMPVLAGAPSFVAAAGGSGAVRPPEPAAASAGFEAVDALVVPPGFDAQVLLAWGDRPFPNAADYVGFDHAHPCWLPIRGAEEGWLVVAHGAVSHPFHEAAPSAPVERATGVPAFAAASRAFDAVVGERLPDVAPGVAPGADRTLAGEALYNGGMSLVRVRRPARAGRFEVIRDAGNRRVHGLSGLAANAARADAYRAVTGWAPAQATGPARARRTGDRAVLVGTGPAATDVFRNVDTDGLGNRIVGTFGIGAATATPWGTVLCGESTVFGTGTFDRDVSDRYPERYPRWASVTEAVLPNGTQAGYRADTAGATFGLVGEKYGWVVEVAPPPPGASASAAPASRKHTALGRFRHGAIAIRCTPGRPLVVYLGEDRPSGHLWKFVSAGVVERVDDPSNPRLLERGTLHVARFAPGAGRAADGASADGSGTWIPLQLDMPTDPVDPAAIVPEGGNARALGRVLLPRRAGIAGASGEGGVLALTVETRAIESIPPGGTEPQSRIDQYRRRPDGTRRTLADFYTSPGALLCDAHPAANLVGGTPCGRPAGIALEPSDGSLLVSMADPRPSPDGDADARIVTVSAGSGERAAQPAGGVWRIVDAQPEDIGGTFRWSREIAGGEWGAGDGVGLGYPCDLRVDGRRNLWIATAAEPSVEHAVADGPEPAGLAADRGSPLVESVRPGLFGANLLAVVPSRGEWAGQVVPFAIAPPRAILSGPNPVGNALLLGVRHPGRDAPSGAAIERVRRDDLPMLRPDGAGVFLQSRTLPTGSGWPAGDGPVDRPAPRPATVAILRRGGGSLL